MSSFQIVDIFITLGLKTVLRIANCYRSIRIKLLKSTAVSQKTSLIVYRTIIRSTVICVSEVRTLDKSDESTSAIRERKVLRKTMGPGKENGVRKIRTDQEVTDQCRETDIISEIRKGILR
jgi:hypothetical protein